MGDFTRIDSGDLKIGGSVGVATSVFSGGITGVGRVSYAPRNNFNVSITGYRARVGDNFKVFITSGTRLGVRRKISNAVSLDGGLGYSRASHGGRSIGSDIGLIIHTDYESLNISSGLKGIALRGSGLNNNPNDIYIGFGLITGLSYQVRRLTFFSEAGYGTVSNQVKIGRKNPASDNNNFGYGGAYLLVGLNLNLK